MLVWETQTAVPLILAPMAGYTDRSFRVICKEAGCDFTETEMVSAKGFHYGSTKSYDLVLPAVEEGRIVIQLFGHEPEILAETAQKIENNLQGSIYAFDINMGCPAPKVVKNGDGSALLEYPERAGDIVRAVSKAVRVPVTVKMRTGVDSNSVIAPDFARRMQDAGVAGITVHGRTRSQMYSGAVDYATIAKVRKAVSVPLIGNGDVVDAASARRMLDETGCDGLMIGRGALGNPWIFTEIKAALLGEEFHAPSLRDRVEKAISHAEKTVTDKGEHGIVELRKHIFYYLRGLKGAAEIKRKLQAAGTLEELRDILLDTCQKHEYNV